MNKNARGGERGNGKSIESLLLLVGGGVGHKTYTGACEGWACRNEYVQYNKQARQGNVGMSHDDGCGTNT